MHCLDSRCTNWTARDDFIHLFSETHREPQCRYLQGIIFMIIKTQTHYTIAYNQNREQTSNSGEGGKFLCVQNMNTSPDAHRSPRLLCLMSHDFGEQ